MWNNANKFDFTEKEVNNDSWLWNEIFRFKIVEKYMFEMRYLDLSHITTTENEIQHVGLQW